VTQWQGPGGYLVDDDRTRLDVPFIHHWLMTESYWAIGRPVASTDRAVANSLNLGLYAPDGAPAGFCRWVTDRATFAWLCDVFVESSHRGAGLGVFLVRTAVEHPDVRGLRLVLGTRDAHELYRRFGFDDLAAPERWMEVPRPVM
jgi:GNAT superfamily N-acetyltransferase